MGSNLLKPCDKTVPLLPLLDLPLLLDFLLLTLNSFTCAFFSVLLEDFFDDLEELPEFNWLNGITFLLLKPIELVFIFNSFDLLLDLDFLTFFSLVFIYF